MLVSTKGRYALRVMIDLAEHDTGDYIPLKDIAERQEISEKYLESIIAVLSRAGVLAGLRGKGGGYKLTRRPDQYTVGNILKLTEGSLAAVEYAEKPNVRSPAVDCRTLPMWKKLDEIIDDYFEGITIADLARSAEAGDNYVI